MKSFNHIQTAHCENGVTASLLNYNGLEFATEPLVFGIGSGIFYLHVPFVKINGGPAITFVNMPGSIFKRTCKALNVDFTAKIFRNENEAVAFLDNMISKGIPVGVQLGVFHLPYFPPEYRFHFNAHYVIVYGKQGNNYMISDPVMDNVTLISEEDMLKARFSKGVLAPKGLVFYPEVTSKVTNQQIRKAIVKGIKHTNALMLHLPGGKVGVTGIKYTARQIPKWRDKLGARKAGQYLGQFVRMQEEIGTGGGGFRFIFASFLEQANNYIENDKLLEIAQDFTKSGDLWRTSAIQMGRIYKGRINNSLQDFNVCSDLLYQISDLEKQAFRKLDKLKLR